MEKYPGLQFSVEELKSRARRHLRKNNVDRAIRIYARIVKNNPDDIDALLVIGDGYLIAGDPSSAMFLYKKAERVNPQNIEIQNRISMINSSNTPLKETVDIHPADYLAIETLIEKIKGNAQKVEEEKVNRAGSLLEEFMRSDSPADAVSKHLGEIDSLLPAFIELNIRQAKSEGNNQLADSLQELLTELLMEEDFYEEQIDAYISPRGQKRSQTKRILMAGVKSEESPYRTQFMKDLISGLGYEIEVGVQSQAISKPSQYDLFIACNPHGDPVLMKTIASRAAANLPVLIDLDIDFEQLPTNHPDYSQLGLHNQSDRRKYNAVLQLADLILVSGEEFKRYLTREGFPVRILHDGWDERNKLWQKPVPERNSLNLGLFVIPGMEEDILSIRRIILRILREFPYTRLVIHGDPSIYRLFDSISDDRCLYLPKANYEDYPYLLSHVDIMLLPLRDLYFNHIKSDKLLMDAGVRKIPWIASPRRSNLLWGTGGLLAENNDGWYSQLQRLVVDGDLRKELGENGYKKAMTRENSKIGLKLKQIISTLLNGSGSV